MKEEKPTFEHPQSQSSQPSNLASPMPQTNASDLVDLRSYVDERIERHIHNGSDARRINANTDIIGLPVVYAGYVNIDGTAGSLPAGWTSSKRAGNGQYTVTHNLNTANYSFVATSYATVVFCKFNAVNVNDVQPDFLSDTGTLTDCKFYFILSLF